MYCGICTFTRLVMFSIYQRFLFEDLLAKSSGSVRNSQPQDVVVMKFTWCEDHGSWYHQTVKMVIISMYRNFRDIWFSDMISSVLVSGSHHNM